MFSGGIVRKKVMILIVFCVVLLTGCIGGLEREPSETVEIGQKQYRTGFYGDLFPNNLEFTDEEYEVGHETFRGMMLQQFECVHAFIGPKSNGTIYCLDSQWGAAKEYYENDDNFTYYCSIGIERIDQKPVIQTISDMDAEKFEELLKFAQANGYDPFEVGKKVNKVVMDRPDEDISPTLLFYKESNDGCFVSFRGDAYHIIDGKMYLVYYYDGKDDSMHAIQVPQELADYFISLTQAHPSENVF